ncbi:MAG TPA: GNAT family N-acetyltransferase [Candidatus Limnocylindrales bacterium]|nr:GNAT family N-acetyltransferase [Candidatus Limnocylindrales bacterium]
MQARRGELVDVLDGGAGVMAFEGAGGDAIGIVTWLREGERAEIRAVAVAQSARRRGVGRALMEAAQTELAADGVRAAWLVTTNDNAPALRLYHSLGYAVTEIRHGAIDEIRRTLKPTIPLVGHAGVEMHDELELTKDLALD